MVDFLKSGQVGTIELNETRKMRELNEIRKMRNEIANRWSSLGSKTVNEGKTNYQSKQLLNTIDLIKRLIQLI